jgi:hypothetical protein
MVSVIASLIFNCLTSSFLIAINNCDEKWKRRDRKKKEMEKGKKGKEVYL